LRIMDGPDSNGTFGFTTRTKDGKFLGPFGGWSIIDEAQMRIRPEDVEPL